MTRNEAYIHMLNAHHGVDDKGGVPYIFHPIAVEAMVEGLGEDFRVVALLHDVQEDTDYDLPLIGEPGGLTLEQVTASPTATTSDASSRISWREWSRSPTSDTT
jgi:(p)ppGpp synthase/HD superfamily hydrolase